MDMDQPIYLKREEIKLGCGSTAKSTIVENYFQVIEVDENHVEIYLLDCFDQPVGKGTLISKEELKEYIPCPDYFKGKKSPKEIQIEKHVQAGNLHYEKREFFSAEYEYNQALAMNQEHLQANLGKGKSLFARGEKEAAKEIFSKLSRSIILYQKENKHVFNELGIELRKRRMFEEAISNYLRAISIDPQDEVLYYNLGRAFYEKGAREEAMGYLRHALGLKANFKEAEEFLSRLQSS